MGVGDKGGLDGCLLGICGRQAVVEGKCIGADEGDVGTHERHGAQRSIAHDCLGDGADGAAEQLNVGNAVACQGKRDGQAIGNYRKLPCGELLADEVC